MDETKSNVNIQRLLITIGIVLFAVLVVGGTTWYVMDKSAKEVQKANDESIAALQKQIDEQKAKTTGNATTSTSATTGTTSGSTATTNQTSGWKTYTNTAFSFTAKYPTDYFFSEATPVEIAAAGDLFLVNFYNNDFKTSPDTTSPLKVEVIKNNGDDLKTWIAFNYRGTGTSIIAKSVNGLAGYTFNFTDADGKTATGFAVTKNGKYYAVTASSATATFNSFLTALTLN